MRLKDAIDFNPTEKLAKNICAKKIGMDKLSPFYKYIDSFEYEKLEMVIQLLQELHRV